MAHSMNLLEINQIVNAEHGDPHHILGLHEIELDNIGADSKVKKNKGLIMRAFIPQAKRIYIIDPKDKDFKFELEKVHDDGFFQAIINDRDTWFRYKLKIEGFGGNKWETYDPYSFPPIISDLDLHLFGEGTHYEIYDKLGSNCVEVDGVEGVLFGVWAPNAKRVSVIGSFNDWDGRRNPMRILGNSGVWELFIPGLQKYDNYKFEIKTFSGDILEKADPYGHFFELRPSSSALVYDIKDHKWNDDSWYDYLKENPPLEGPMNVYEVHLGSWAKDKDGNFLTYMEFSDVLVKYVKEMGYTHVELMPVQEYPFDGSWGYQVTGYYAPTSRFGTPHEFMYFVDKCHQNNIGVILDWVPAHFPKDSHGLAKFDGTALYEHQDPKKGEHPEWGTLIFNYGRKEVKNFLIANALFWIEKYHIDGLRVDAVASMLYLDYGKNDGEWIPNEYGGNHNLEAVEFLKHMNSVILGRHPNVLMVAEESTSWAGVSRPVEQNGLGFNLKWNMGWMNDFLSYIIKDPIYRKYHQNNLTFGMIYAYTENFMLVLSHDEVVHGKKSLIDKMPGDIWQKCANLRLSYTYMFGFPGKKLLFMGGEFGQFIEWDEKRSLDWFLLEYDHHKQIQDFVKDINNLYKEEKAFYYDDFKGNGFEWINCNDNERSLLTFIRKSDKEEDTLYFALNFTPNVIEDYLMGVSTEGKYKEILNSDSPKYGGSGVTNDFTIESQPTECDGRPHSLRFRLPPLGGVIFKKEQQ